MCLVKYILLIASLLLFVACSNDTDTPSPTLTASLSANVTSGVAPLEVMFDASESTGNIVSYQWDFDDGNTANGVQVQHTFSAGTFTVRLMVENEEGGSDEATTTLNVTAPNQAPEASFTFTPDTGDALLEVQFDASASQDADGEIVSYQWDFGDGNTATGVTSTHTFQSAGVFEVRLIVTDDAGETASKTLAVTVLEVNQPPIARILLTPEEDLGENFDDSCTPIFYLPETQNSLTIQADASASEDPNDDELTYVWDFDDGTILRGERVSYTYDREDWAYEKLTVTLTVTDDRGASHQTRTQVLIPPSSLITSNSRTVATTNQSPVARMTLNFEGILNVSFPSLYRDGVCHLSVPVSEDRETFTIQFDGGSSKDSEGDELSYRWDFGDGTTAQGEVVTHTYDREAWLRPEPIVATLTITDSQGASQQAERILGIYVPPSFP
jgi:PKD repeat protein